MLCGYGCDGSSEKLCFSLIPFDTNRFAKCVEGFDEPFNALQWPEEVGVVDE